jgi:carbamoyltransferase
VFKRWTREQSPSELFNHGFENMESLGAVYSRISSHILGDWNACGKVMGLTSWNSKHFKETDKWIFGKDKPSTLNLGKDFYHKYDLMKGNPYIEGDFFINWDVIESIPEPNVFNANNFGRSAVLASSVQMDLEASALSLVDSLRSVTQQQNLALAGGVALNSVMNGRIVK